jgi:hypothetical protein
MKPAMTLDEESGPCDWTQNRTRNAFCTAHAPISLPDKEELLLCLYLNLIHKHRQKLPERHPKQTRYFSVQRSGIYESR